MNSRVEIIYLILLLIYACVMGMSQIVLANAASQINQSIQIKGFSYSIFSSSWLYLGLFIYIIATAFWLFMLTKVDIRLAYPIASLSIVFSSLLQSLITNSYPSTIYWVGLIIVIFGLALINFG